MKHILKFTFIASNIVLCSNAYANFFDDYMIDPDDGMLDASRYISEVPLGFLPVPQVITEPAVGVGIGLGAVFFHESDEQKKLNSTKAILPKDITVLGLGATENGTRGLGAAHFGFWQQDSLRYKGFALYPDINLNFYSLAGTQLPKPIKLNISGPVIIQELKKRVGPEGVFLGARQLYRKVDSQLANSLDTQNSQFNDTVNDYLAKHLDKSTTTSGLGLVAEYDSRNNPINPESGFNYAFNYTWFDDVLGSEVDYQSIKLAGLNYWQLNDQFNLAWRVQYDGVNIDNLKDLPSYVPPSIDLRGVAAARYQGTDVVVTELEASYKINFRWKINAFTGTGRAANSFSDLSDAKNANSIGTGFRYLVAKRYGFIMGLDVARGPEETTVYIQAGSSW